ncbi:hypothetical protein [Brevundimonas aurifodinae]|uniref:Uncharacterized protein n=1 Tax=Brevundimonas aurifodinae TaxID=1508312 RepID=A0ABV1NMI0_9CAUL
MRLVDSDGRAGGEIALLSIDVAGALREVCLHSPDRSGFELWQEGRMILRFYCLPAEDGTPVQPV